MSRPPMPPAYLDAKYTKPIARARVARLGRRGSCRAVAAACEQGRLYPGRRRRLRDADERGERHEHDAEHCNRQEMAVPLHFSSSPRSTRVCDARRGAVLRRSPLAARSSETAVRIGRVELSRKAPPAGAMITLISCAGWPDSLRTMCPRASSTNPLAADTLCGVQVGRRTGSTSASPG